LRASTAADAWRHGRPAGAPDPVASGLVAPLGSILRQLSKGGGAAGINIDDITVELDKLTRDYPFQARAS